MAMITRILALLLLMGCLLSHASAQSLVDGVRKYEAGDYAGAIIEWEPLARQGNADAQFNLGQVYRLGRGAPVDLDRAADYYESAARQGHIDAQGNLATLYFFSNDDPAKRDEAVEWWRTAAKAGDARSQYMMSILLFNGDFLEKDHVEAYGWAILAIAGGLEEARDVELKMRRHLSVEQMARGRLLSRDLVNIEEVANNDPAPPVQAASQVPIQEPVPEPTAAPEPADTPPAPAPEPEAVMTTPAATPQPQTQTEFAASWRLQIGSFRSREIADGEWQRIRDRFGDLVGSLRHDVIAADLGPDRGIFYRLQAGPFASRETANARCEQMKASGLNCFILAP